MSYGGEILVHPAMSSPMLSRVTYPDDPGASRYGGGEGAMAFVYDLIGGGGDRGDRLREDYITHETAMTYSAVWACVRVISQSLAGLGWSVYERKPSDPRFKMPLEYDVSWLLGLQTGPEHSAFCWREVMLKDALTWGNGYSEIERTPAGRPYWMHYLSAPRVTPMRDGGQLLYEVDNGPGNDPTYLMPEDVFHLKGPGPDGLAGWDMIALFRRAIKLGLSEERYGDQFFSRGPMPGGTVTIPGNMTNEQRKEFRRSFEEVYAGARNMHRIIVLSNGVAFTPASLPNDSAQFLQSRRFQVSEVCRIYGVPPHKLADLERATFSNVEEQERAFVTDCLLPWARRLESEADLKLFGPVNRGRRFTKLNLDALMRGNSTTQTATVTQKVNSGINTVNEAREFFDLNPIEGGDTPLIQGAMVPLENAVNPPEPPAPAPAPRPGAPPSSNGKAAPSENGQAMPAGAKGGDLEAALLPVFAEATGRAARRGEHRLADARKRCKDQAALSARAEKFLAEHRQYLLEACLPPARALAELSGATPSAACAGLNVWAERYLGLLASRLATDEAPDMVFSGSDLDAADLCEAVLCACAANRREPPATPRGRVVTKTVLRDERGRIAGIREERLP